MIGRASVAAQFLSMVPGSKSGPVAFVVSIALRSRSVQRVRKRVKVGMVGAALLGCGGGGVEVCLKLFSKVLAKS